MFKFLLFYKKHIYNEDRFLLKNVAKVDLLFMQKSKKYFKIGINMTEAVFKKRFISCFWL
jgi:hypothetical protein